MRKDFKKAGYLGAFVIFIVGVVALIISTAVNYFAYDVTVVVVGQFVSLIALLWLLIICVISKRNYNDACVRFAEYILSNRKKDAERAKELQNIQTAAAKERETAVAAALEQGRNEGAAETTRAMQSSGQSAYIQQVSPADEILYNEYGEPVLIRRRVKKKQPISNDSVLYDKFGNPAELPMQASNATDYGFDDDVNRDSFSDRNDSFAPQPINVNPYAMDNSGDFEI